MRLRFLTLAAASALALAACGDQGGSSTRDGIWAAGSSTVFPFTTRVAENFARNTGGAMPRVESLGTGGGIQAFCQGIGAQTPDIANASRRMKASEFDLCAANGVTEIIEIKIGFDGLVIATARTGADFAFEGDDLFLALAKDVPGEGGFVAHWSDMLDEVREPSAARQGTSGREAERAMELAAVKVRLANLRTFPCVQEKEGAGALKLHGAFFAISDGVLHLLDEDSGEFRPAA